MTPQLKSLITAEDSKVDVAAVDENGCSALVWAARNGHADTVTYLVGECGADVESASYGGLRALHHACNNNHEGIIKLLLEKDASPNAVDDAGNMTLRKLGGRLAPSLLRAPLTTAPPPDFAAAGGILNILGRLLDKGADTHAANNAGATPLHKACIYGQLACAKKLVEKVSFAAPCRAPAPLTPSPSLPPFRVPTSTPPTRRETPHCISRREPASV